MGEEVVPWLILIVREEWHEYSRGGTNLTPLCWLVRLLASYGSPLATDILFQVACIEVRDADFPGMVAFHEHLALLQKLPDPLAIPALVAALTKLQGRYGFLPDMLDIARFLITKAEQAPCPELYPALPLLRPRFGAPRVYREQYGRLKAALGEGNLPIPATPPQTNAGLADSYREGGSHVTMSYQNRPDYRQPFEQLAGEREQEDCERQVALFVTGTPRQREQATTWLVEYLEEANRETDVWRQWRNIFRGQFPLYPLTFQERASGLLALFQNQPREVAQQALGEAAAGHHSLWRVLCLGLQSYGTAADRFFLAAAAARVAVAHWETPTAVGKLREALTQLQGGTVDTLCGQTILALARELRPHTRALSAPPPLSRSYNEMHRFSHSAKSYKLGFRLSRRSISLFPPSHARTLMWIFRFPWMRSRNTSGRFARVTAGEGSTSPAR